MKPLLHPSSSSFILFFFFFSVSLLILSINTPTCLSDDDDDRYTHCNTSFSCENSSVSNLKYPFWGEEREKYCGSGVSNPNMELTCEEGFPKITINEVKYRILQWEEASQRLKVARDDYGGGDICSVTNNYKNSTFQNSSFQRDGAASNVTLLYGCDANANTANRIYSMACGSTTIVYTIADPSTVTCSPSVVVVIPLLGSLDTTSQVMTGTGLNEALKEGFDLRWSGGDYRACETCLGSGGVCGNDGGNGFICFCKNGAHTNTCDSAMAPTLSPSDKKSNSAIIGIGAAVGVAVLVGFLAFGCFLVRRRRRNAENSRSKELFMPTSSSANGTGTDTDNPTSITKLSQSVPSYPSSKSHDTVQKSFYFGVQVFTYAELEEATNNFHTSRELGEGGFGTVYKGELKDGRVVAVKRHYESNFKRVEQFMNEVEILAHLRHKNLVALYGCTSKHSKELLLVYEFIPNGTVADHLHGKSSKSTLLPWSIRLNIAIETAEALAFLHASDVIHRDVKSNNILLDEKFHVKVADFGLSRLFPNQVTHVSTAPQGTPGYVDPEYYQSYQLTDKSDVYSFGVILVELISSLQAVDISRNRNDVNLANMAISKIQNQQLHELVEPYLGFDKDPSVRRMTTGVAELAFRCLQQERDMRPSMDEVLETLRGIKSDELEAKEGKVVGDGVNRSDEIVLLKKVGSPNSPTSVADKWVSGSSTTSTSS